MDGATVGKISKNYAGFIKEAVSKADNFSISCRNYILKSRSFILNVKL